MEETIINYLISNAHIFGAVGIIIVFAVSLFESTPFLGLFIPAQTILVLAGFFAKIGDVNFWHICVFAIIGSLIGDIVSFYLGRKFGTDLLSKYGFRFLIKKEYIEKTQTLLDEHLGKTLFIGRLSSIPRSMAPFLAGASNVKFGRFALWATGGAILWSYVFVGLGFIFAQSFDIVGLAIGKFIFSAVIIVILMLLVIGYMRKKNFYLTNKHTGIIMVSVLSLFAFSVIGQSVLEQTNIKEVDMAIKPAIENLRNGTLTPIMTIITNMSDKIPLTLITILTALLMFIRKRQRESLQLLFAMFVGVFSVYLIKIVIASPRPVLGLIEETGFSFPSGHATLSMIFSLTLGYVFIKNNSKEHHIWCTVFIAMFFPLIVGFSRLYLGVHWLSDVLGGFMLGIFVTTISILVFDFLPWFYKKIKTRQIAPNL